MPTLAPMKSLDLLLVGGLTIDRLPDGSLDAGGSVLHAARATAGAGWRVGVVLSAGDEPQARDAVREIRRLVALTHVDMVERSIGFEHGERPTGRKLRFTGSGRPLACAPLATRPSSVLYLPVADELAADLAGQSYPGARCAAVLQGWLRRLEAGRWVRPVSLRSLPAALVARLRGFELLMASREDLAAEGADPPAQLRALRAKFGSHPTLIVTDGINGAWLDAGGLPRPEPAWQMPVVRRIDGVSTIGAGDVFAAGMMVGAPAAPASRAELSRQAKTAMAMVATMLEGRRDR
jgi:sugar/nucleoside kinase (ribokinase family)